MNAGEAQPKEQERAPTRAKRKRSAVSSGRRLLVAGSSTTPWGRRYADILAGHVADLSGGAGADALSQAQVSLCRRAASLTVECEALEGRASQGEAIDLDSLGRAVSHLRRVLATMGLERAKPKGPTLQEYLARNYPADTGAKS